MCCRGLYALVFVVQGVAKCISCRSHTNRHSSYLEWRFSFSCSQFVPNSLGLDVPRTRLNKTFGNNQRIYITCVQMIVHTLATHLIILPIFVKARGIILSYSYEGAFTFYVNDSEYTVGTREDDHLPRCRVCR